MSYNIIHVKSLVTSLSPQHAPISKLVPSAVKNMNQEPVHIEMIPQSMNASIACHMLIIKTLPRDIAAQIFVVHCIKKKCTVLLSELLV